MTHRETVDPFIADLRQRADTTPEAEQETGAPPGAEWSGRRLAALIALGTLLLLALGVWGNWPWLATEHARLNPTQRWLIWAADGTALLWTAWFGLWHGVLGKPLP